jgi:hypothetical protein
MPIKRPAFKTAEARSRGRLSLRLEADQEAAFRTEADQEASFRTTRDIMERLAVRTRDVTIRLFVRTARE